jgi:AbiV family abortive infection protein
VDGSFMARKTKIDGKNMSMVAASAKKNSEMFLEEAKDFAIKQKFARAYAFLVFALEEAAKKSICNMHDIWLIELEVSKKAGRNPEGPEISEKKVEEVFKNHHSKRITVLTQLIFALTNTFDLEKRTRIINAIHNADPESDPELKNLIQIFKKMYKIRATSLYVEADNTGPTDINEADYLELIRYVEIIVNDRGGTFTSFKNEKYEETEEKIGKLLEDSYLGPSRKPTQSIHSHSLRTHISVTVPLRKLRR